jgi:hypothetical protein
MKSLGQTGQSCNHWEQMMPRDEETQPPGLRRARAGRRYELPEGSPEPNSTNAPRPWQPRASPNVTHHLEPALLLLLLTSDTHFKFFEPAIVLIGHFFFLFAHRAVCFPFALLFDRVRFHIPVHFSFWIPLVACCMEIPVDPLVPSLPMFVHLFQCLSVECHVRDSLSWSRFLSGMMFFLTGRHCRSSF